MGAPHNEDKGTDKTKIGLAVLVGLLAVWVIVAMLWGGGVIGDNDDTIEKVIVKERLVYPDATYQLGVRPMWLVDGMEPSPLKTSLEQCRSKPIQQQRWSIGHRGAPLMFPEHTEESYRAAAQQGAGIMECDVTFTRDRQLVCRHAECDLHTTTNILDTPLASTCEVPFTPATNTTAATAKCCASALTLAEFRTLHGKMDSYDSTATTVAQFLGGNPTYRTQLYASRGTLMTHAESIALFKALGVQMTPELKAGNMQSDFTREQFILQALNEYRASGVKGSDVFLQSFLREDIQYVVDNAPDFAETAVFLTDPTSGGVPANLTQYMSDIQASGIKYIAPPVNALAAIDAEGHLVQTDYGIEATKAGLKIISWSWERSAWYHNSVASLLDTPSKLMHFLDFLAQEVGIVGLFSDWPATVTYYANCLM